MDQIDDLVRLLGRILDDGLLGAYLHGSAVIGGLKPTSDIDVLAVARRSLTTAQRRSLVRGVMALSGRRAVGGPARPVELVVVVASDVRPWRYPPVCDFLYGEWLRAGFMAGHVPEREQSPDLAPLLAMVLLGNRALAGPPPAALLDPVPSVDLRRAIVEGVPGLLEELDTDTRNVILTLARIWTTLETGAIRSKDAAADWALGRLPAAHRPVLARARAIYLGDAEESFAGLEDRIRPHADHVVTQIARARSAPDPSRV